MAVTIYGVVAVSFMMVMYTLESRSRHFIAAFALVRAVEQLRVPRYLAVRRRRGRLDLDALRRYVSTGKIATQSTVTHDRKRDDDSDHANEDQRDVNPA